MIKFDKNEFLKPRIYSTNDYGIRCVVTEEIVNDIKRLQRENKKYKKVINEVKNRVNSEPPFRIYDDLLVDLINILWRVEE